MTPGKLVHAALSETCQPCAGTFGLQCVTVSSALTSDTAHRCTEALVAGGSGEYQLFFSTRDVLGVLLHSACWDPRAACAALSSRHTGEAFLVFEQVGRSPALVPLSHVITFAKAK